MKEKLLKLSSIFFSIMCLLIVVFAITVKKTEKETEFGDLIVDTETNKNPNSIFELKANARVESGVTKVTVTAFLKGTVEGFGTGYDTTLRWDLAWASPKEEEVSDYVKLDVISNKVVQLTYIKQFDTQIILTATSVANESISATCTIDCYERSNFDEYTLNINGTNHQYTFDSGEANMSNAYSIEEIVCERPLDLSVSAGSPKVGTIATTTTTDGTLTLSSELEAAFRAKGYTEFNSIDFDDVANYGFFTAIEYLCNDQFALFSRNDGMLLNRELHEILAETECWFTLSFENEDLYNGNAVHSSHYDIDILMDYNPSFGEIVSIDLTEKNIIF